MSSGTTSAPPQLFPSRPTRPPTADGHPGSPHPDARANSARSGPAAAEAVAAGRPRCAGPAATGTRAAAGDLAERWDSPARAAAAAAAAELVEPGMTIGLGSGRAVWAVLDLLRDRGIRSAAASARTEELLREAGIEVVEPDGSVRLALAIDGADEIDPSLGLIKGGGAALLREKLLVEAADRFVVVAEASKKVARLGETRGLPIEVVRFAWGSTR